MSFLYYQRFPNVFLKPTAIQSKPKKFSAAPSNKFDFHFNANLTALNLAKVDLLNQYLSEDPIVDLF
jgi:hypothetical protein